MKNELREIDDCPFTFYRKQNRKYKENHPQGWVMNYSRKFMVVSWWHNFKPPGKAETQTLVLTNRQAKWLVKALNETLRKRGVA